jgi:quercetin dioxygenase-like cupin family protein
MTDGEGDGGEPPRVEIASLAALDGTVRPFESESEPTVVRLALDAGASVDPHTHPGRGVVFYALDGTFEVTVAGDEWRVEPGDCLRFDGENAVSPRATADGPATALVLLGRR